MTTPALYHEFMILPCNLGKGNVINTFLEQVIFQVVPMLFDLVVVLYTSLSFLMRQFLPFSCRKQQRLLTLRCLGIMHLSWLLSPVLFAYRSEDGPMAH